MVAVKKIFSILLAVFLISSSGFSAKAQGSVGIGTTTPLELLDVNGNINLRGKIKLNNVEGNPGSVLSVGQDGNPVWAAAQEFTTFMAAYTDNASVVIPASARKVMIEAWGAGGGGAQGGGGASGHYAMGIFEITQNTPLTITIGTAGAAATTYTGAAGNGGSTTVTGAGVSVTAGGGRGANAFFGGLLPNNGAMASAVTGGSRVRFVVINGENGHPTTQTTHQVGSTTWHTHVYFGRGGNPPLGIGMGGNGSFRIHLSTLAGDGNAIKLYQGGYAGIAGGGGGGQKLPSEWGWDGGRGYVIVRY